MGCQPSGCFYSNIDPMQKLLASQTKRVSSSGSNSFKTGASPKHLFSMSNERDYSSPKQKITFLRGGGMINSN